MRKDLGGGLGLTADQAYFSIFRDNVTGLEYIRNSKELCDKGLYVELGAYKYHVFIDFREIRDNEWHQYANLTAYLNGRGVPNLEEALKEMFLQPVQYALKELVNVAVFHRLMDARLKKPEDQPDQELMSEIEQKATNLLREAKRLSEGMEDELTISPEMRRKLEVILYLPTMANRFPWSVPPEGKTAAEYLMEKLIGETSPWYTIFNWLFVHALGRVVSQTDSEERSRSWIDEWRLGKTIASVLGDLELEETSVWKSVSVVKLLTRHQRWYRVKRSGQNPAYRVLESLLKDGEVHQFLQVNRYNDTLWFNKEAFNELRWWLFLAAAVEISSDPLRSAYEVVKDVEECYTIIKTLHQAEKKSSCQLEKLLEAI
jgi:hypothetical protein